MSQITDSAAIENVTLSAPDISCAHCVKTVEGTLRGLDGITSVKADADTSLVDVQFDSEVISLGKIEAMLEEAGYPIAH